MTGALNKILVVLNYMITDLSLVECFEALDCTNSTKSLGMMTTPECCIENSSGLAYTKPGLEKCHICIGNQNYNIA